VDSPGTGGGATGASTIASVDAAGTVNEGSSPSPALGCKGGPTRIVEEEEAIDYGKEQRKRKKKKKILQYRERGEEGDWGREPFLFSNTLFPLLLKTQNGL
jgi:hypothetical protein